MTNIITTTPRSIDFSLERYLAIYNEVDPAQRRADIETLWTPDAILANAVTIYRGHDEIEAGISRSHDRWVGSGHEFRPSGIVSVQHSTVRFVWTMHLDGDPEPVSVGTNFMTLTVDGRRAADHQFIDR